MRRVGVGVIGTGSFGRKHVAAYAALPQAELVAVCDADRERAEAVAAEFGVAAVYPSFEELVADPRVEAVSVVTPEADHVGPTLRALEAGKPTLVEKPLAATVEDARLLVDAAERTGTPLVPGHILRFETHYAELYGRFHRGELGEIVSISARRNRTRELFATYQRTHPALETMIHDIDQILWYTGEMPTTVSAWARNTGGLQNPNALWATLEFPSGMIAQLETVWLLPEAAGLTIDDELRVTGTRATACLDFASPALTLRSPHGTVLPDLHYEPILMGRGVGALREELAYFVSCVATGQPLTRVTAQDGLAAVEVAHAIIRATR